MTPQDSSRELRELQAEMERLRGELANATEQPRAHQEQLEKREQDFHERLAEQARSQAEGEPGQVSRGHGCAMPTGRSTTSLAWMRNSPACSSISASPTMVV